MIILQTGATTLPSEEPSMTIKTTPDNDHTIAFDCPKCQLRTKVALEQVGHTYHCRVKCSCGNVFTAVIEFRERTRRQLDVPGRYQPAGGEAAGTDNCRIIDVSRIGLAFLKNDTRQLNPGDTIRVSFRLNDPEATEIVQDCEVKHVRDNFVGCRLLTENTLLDDYLSLWL